jgi:hypothetical protein
MVDRVHMTEQQVVDAAGGSATAAVLHMEPPGPENRASIADIPNS